MREALEAVEAPRSIVRRARQLTYVCWMLPIGSMMALVAYGVSIAPALVTLMNKIEARRILFARIRELRDVPYEDLLELRSPSAEVVEAESGTQYQVEVYAFWDNERKQTLRVVVAVDDGGIRSYFPMTSEFIVAPDGSFVGE